MVAATGVIALFVLLGVAVPLVIWLLTEAETDDGEVLDREAAERVARDEVEETARRDGWNER